MLSANIDRGSLIQHKDGRPAIVLDMRAGDDWLEFVVRWFESDGMFSKELDHFPLQELRRSPPVKLLLNDLRLQLVAPVIARWPQWVVRFTDPEFCSLVALIAQKRPDDAVSRLRHITILLIGSLTEDDAREALMEANPQRWQERVSEAVDYLRKTSELITHRFWDKMARLTDEGMQQSRHIPQEEAQSREVYNKLRIKVIRDQINSIADQLSKSGLDELFAPWALKAPWSADSFGKRGPASSSRWLVNELHRHIPKFAPASKRHRLISDLLRVFGRADVTEGNVRKTIADREAKMRTRAGSAAGKRPRSNDEKPNRTLSSIRRLVQDRLRQAGSKGLMYAELISTPFWRLSDTEAKLLRSSIKELQKEKKIKLRSYDDRYELIADE